MVDIANVPKISALISEARNLSRVIDNLNADGQIDMMRISPGPEQAQGVPVMLAMVDWEYPAGMVATIISKCQARRNEIDKELEAAGVTGVEARRT